MSTAISEKRADYSKMRLTELRKRLDALDELRALPQLTVFGAGSYGRHEASEYSDIDMFFLSKALPADDLEPRTNSLRMFGKVIQTIDTMKFPKFSNDCEYLVILRVQDLLSSLGSRADDHDNFFTARMLMLLESKCLYGEPIYDGVLQQIVASYFRDFEDHQDTFIPLFLMNDICRFWKTLLLNYENKRSSADDSPAAVARKTKHKIRNFKLKFSRMTTCFASVAALGSYSAPVTQEQVLEIVRLTPRERLNGITKRLPAVGSEVASLLEKYDWFLEMTGLRTVDLESKFADKARRVEMSQRAKEYGDAMYNLLRSIDATDPHLRLVRNLVV